MTLLRGNSDLFCRTWNSSEHAQEAIDAIRTLTGATEEGIRTTARALLRAGAIRSLPVRQGAFDLTLEEVFTFCMTWNRAASAATAVQQLGLAPAVVYERANILRRQGVSLDNKIDWTFDTLKVTRTDVWGMDVDVVNAVLNEELLVRNGLMRREGVKKKVGVLVRSLVKIKNDPPDTDVLEAFVAVAESLLRDLGVTA